MRKPRAKGRVIRVTLRGGKDTGDKTSVKGKMLVPQSLLSRGGRKKSFKKVYARYRQRGRWNPDPQKWGGGRRDHQEKGGRVSMTRVVQPFRPKSKSLDLLDIREDERNRARSERRRKKGKILKPPERFRFGLIG